MKGVPTKGRVDGQELTAKLVPAGTYLYRPFNRTVDSYIPYLPLTKEQFTDALAKGFKLVNYRAHKVMLDPQHSAVESGGKPVPATKIIATPVS